jgi:L-fucose mutarotase
MLIGVPPPFSDRNLLATLRAMGHGDEIAIVDGNYPALEHARRLVRADGHGLHRQCSTPSSRCCRSTISCPRRSSDRRSWRRSRSALTLSMRKCSPSARGGRPAVQVVPLVGEAFYARVKGAPTPWWPPASRRLYANIIIRKGVIYP